MHLRPQTRVSPEELDCGRHWLVLDAAWASVTGALSGGVVLVAFALALGAGPMAIGALAAIPFVAQIAQLPAIALVERVRQRKRIGVVTLGVARALFFPVALLPFLPIGELRLPLLLAAQFAIAALGSAASCAINGWFHELLPAETLGSFFAKRLVVATVVACAFTPALGWLVDHPPRGDAMVAYATAFVGAGMAGFASCLALARTPEPAMQNAVAHQSLRALLRAPFRDPNFRRLLFMLGSWNLATNLSAPFLTVYLLQQLGYGLATVTGLWVASQAANALTLYIWGRLSDRLTNKSVLAVAFPVYFVCALGLVFTRVGAPYGLQLPLLYLVHVLMGAASGGIGLATGNLGLKLAPRGMGTSYLAAVGLVGAVSGGITPLVGGAISGWLASNQLSVVVRWVAPDWMNEVSVLSFAHMEFLFALTALLGILVTHALSRVQEGEGGEISERRVVQELAFEALRSINHLAAIGSVLGSVFPFKRFRERRRWSRGPPASP